MKKIKVWGKLKLYEASAVGIPSYPDARFTSFSLIKALTNASVKGFVEETAKINETQLNMEEKEETMEPSQQEVNEEVEEKVEEAVEETEEPKEPETSESKPEEAEKQIDMSELVAKAIKEGIKDSLKELEKERGLIDKEEKSFKDKSLGELAISMSGLSMQK